MRCTGAVTLFTQPAVLGRSCKRPACPRTTSASSPAFQNFSQDASRRCILRCLEQSSTIGSTTHVKQRDTYAIPSLDTIVVNLYPFEATIAREATTLAEAIEQIDVGGVSLLRAAAKNFAHVSVQSHP